MTEEEWYSLGQKLLDEWAEEVEDSVPGDKGHLTSNEESAFEYAWELAGREMGIVA